MYWEALLSASWWASVLTGAQGVFYGRLLLLLSPPHSPPLFPPLPLPLLPPPPLLLLLPFSPPYFFLN